MRSKSEMEFLNIKLVSQGFLLRLRRRTVRKGSAFPAGTIRNVGEAAPRHGGVASQSPGWTVTESRRLSARCGGRAASGMLTAVFLLFGFVAASAQEPVPSPTPSAPQEMHVTPIAQDFRANANKPLPDLARIGVDSSQQRPLTVREALEMALANNKDIEVARDNVHMAEFDLLGARGAYDPAR